MNIAMFTNVFPPHVGGVAHSVKRCVEGARRRGHRVMVVAPEWRDRQPDEQDVVRIPAIQNMTDMDVSLPLPLQSTVEQAVQRVRPELIHSHHPYMLGSMALRVAAAHVLPLVFTYHTRYEFYAHYVRPDSTAVQEFAARLGTGYCELADQVIAPSESIRELLKDRGVQTPIEAIPTGVDLEEYADGDGRAARDKLGIPREAFLCGTVSRLAPEKNVGFLCAAVARFLERNQEAHFLVVGYGPSERDMQDTVAQKGVGERCHFAGKTTGQELVDAYHAMDAFTFASQTETQGMVLVEALAAGCPLVALDAPGAREVVQPH
ncbi:MAG: glycosyltransferase [Candidatus Brocadiia bacterium]